eukprot:CAMPEP_0201151214 /NCGR_PEP_ID=MMETSP0851-20130426/12181_1 /ASSEMBLY_ACC=CAM_ASM_000631 /TAXON_ID=183588 /ORGANISM="Pseudo-nitzschia fraudulenta, Strain WWA7" /LENGTH=526 /DNA_ID=CAMNT_0047428023 /DNA_START=255 /DNA_END=1835 /DNA_ORIENTATION=-
MLSSNRRSVVDSLSWLGEQAQTQFLDRNLDNHQRSGTGSNGGSPFPSFQRLSSYKSLDFDQKHTIRHQVIVWSVGIPDVKSHTVKIMFRVTLFWNDPPPPPQIPVFPPVSMDVGQQQQEVRPRSRSNSSNAVGGGLFHNSGGVLNMSKINSNINANNTNNDNNNDNNNNADTSNDNDDDDDNSYWVMDGRRKAIRRRQSFADVSKALPINNTNNNRHYLEGDTIDVPPVSIINADTFEIVGRPDITLLRKKSRLMRFSCMYRAQLLQESMNVSQFPHDSHDLVLKLGILAQRQPGGRWDRRKWKLGLANESDTQGSVRVPFGVLVDHVAVPGFQISDRGLEFELSPIDYGKSATTMNINNSGTGLVEHFNRHNDQDFCVKTKIRVKRNSAYYDRNIMPLLDILNLVSISILVSLDANNFFQRGLLCLNIAFVEVGLRTSLDARLPTVGYEIKMQKLLNSYFFSILYIVLESAAMKVLVENHDWPVERTRLIDHVVAFLLLLNQFYLRMIIYKDFSELDEFHEFSDR